MGILPLQFSVYPNASTYGPDSAECTSLAPFILNQKITVIRLRRGNGGSLSITTLVRIDTLNEFALCPQNDILHCLLRRLINDSN